MQLIVILLATVSVLTFLSGAIVFFGSSKADRIRSAWYFLAAIFATAWMYFISVFFGAKSEMADTIIWYTNLAFISAIFVDVAFLGYGAWSKKYGKIATMFFLILGTVISGIILINPSSLCSSVTISATGNGATMNIGPLYFSYIAFFGAIVPAIIAVFFHQFLKSRSKRKRNGDIVTMISFGASSTVVLLVNLVLPLFNNWNFVWLGPLALAVTILGVYYTILRYRILNLSSVWLRIFSYIIMVTSIAIIYMIIFSVIFAALFRGSTPSIEVIILNFIMILIFITMMPAINSIMNSVKSLIAGQNNDSEKDQN